jgi:hypothetical protein
MLLWSIIWAWMSLTQKRKLRDYIGQFWKLRDELDPRIKIEGLKQLFCLCFTRTCFLKWNIFVLHLFIEHHFCWAMYQRLALWSGNKSLSMTSCHFFLNINTSRSHWFSLGFFVGIYETADTRYFELGFHSIYWCHHWKEEMDTVIWYSGLWVMNLSSSDSLLIVYHWIFVQPKFNPCC